MTSITLMIQRSVISSITTPSSQHYQHMIKTVVFLKLCWYDFRPKSLIKTDSLKTSKLIFVGFKFKIISKVYMVSQKCVTRYAEADSKYNSKLKMSCRMLLISA